MPRKRPPSREPAQLTDDCASAIWNLVDAARVLETEISGNHKMLVSQLLGEVRRILRRGEPEPP